MIKKISSTSYGSLGLILKHLNQYNQIYNFTLSLILMVGLYIKVIVFITRYKSINRMVFRYNYTFLTFILSEYS